MLIECEGLCVRVRVEEVVACSLCGVWLLALCATSKSLGNRSPSRPFCAREGSNKVPQHLRFCFPPLIPFSHIHPALHALTSTHIHQQQRPAPPWLPGPVVCPAPEVAGQQQLPRRRQRQSLTPPALCPPLPGSKRPRRLPMPHCWPTRASRSSCWASPRHNGLWCSR